MNDWIKLDTDPVSKIYTQQCDRCGVKLEGHWLELIEKIKLHKQTHHNPQIAYMIYNLIAIIVIVTSIAYIIMQIRFFPL